MLQKRSKRSHVSGEIELEFFFLPFNPPDVDLPLEDYADYLIFMRRKLALCIAEKEKERSSLTAAPVPAEKRKSKTVQIDDGAADGEPHHAKDKEAEREREMAQIIVEKFCARYGVDYSVVLADDLESAASTGNFSLAYHTLFRMDRDRNHLFPSLRETEIIEKAKATLAESAQKVISEALVEVSHLIL